MKKLSKLLYVAILLIAPVFLMVTPALAQEDMDVDVLDSTYEDWEWDYDYSYDTTYDLTEEEAIGLAKNIAKIGLGIAAVGLVFGLGTYIYTSLALSKVGEKLGYERNWFAWVPILNAIMILELGDQNPLLLLLALIPGLGALALMIISVIAIMNICEKRGFNKNLGLLTLLPLANLVLIGYIAWAEPK
jgi:hypothetical protein